MRKSCLFFSDPASNARSPWVDYRQAERVELAAFSSKILKLFPETIAVQMFHLYIICLQKHNYLLRSKQVLKLCEGSPCIYSGFYRI